MQKRLALAYWLVVTAAVVGPAMAADVSTNDILGIADYANGGFQKGFGIGLPILIVLTMLGWLLFGLRRGTRGKK